MWEQRLFDTKTLRGGPIEREMGSRQRGMGKHIVSKIESFLLSWNKLKIQLEADGDSLTH